MLTQIDVDSENAFFVPILGVTPKDSLLVRKITGLNPPDIQLFIGDYARDGGIYQGRRVGNRNVVITFDLNPNPALGETISGLRQVLYKAFVDPQVDADYIKLTLHDDEGATRYLVGYTEKFETEIFDIDTMAQISIICPDPYIRDDVKTVLTEPVGWVTVPFTYTGTAETGFEVEIYLNSPTSTLTLENNSKTMVVSHSFVATDVVYVNTIRGSRALMKATASDVDARSAMDVSARWADLEANSLTTPLVASLSALSPWLELHSQANVMKVYGATTSDLISVVRTLAYTQAYWGM